MLFLFQILLKNGPYGFYVQLGEDRKGYLPKRASVSHVCDLCVCVFFFSFFLNDPNTVHVKFDVMCSINHALYAYSRVYLM